MDINGKELKKSYFLLITGSWCSKCKLVKPLVEIKAKELGYNYFEIENNEENLPLTNKLGLEYLPTLYINEPGGGMDKLFTEKIVGVLRIKNYLENKKN